jgi:hypothetical protein
LRPWRFPDDDLLCTWQLRTPSRDLRHLLSPLIFQSGCALRRASSSLTRRFFTLPASRGKFYARNHCGAELFLDGLLHRLSDKFQVAVVTHVELDFVPNRGELWQRKMINWFLQQLRVKELDDSAWMSPIEMKRATDYRNDPGSEFYVRCFEERGIFLSNKPDINKLQRACLEEKCPLTQIGVAESFR